MADLWRLTTSVQLTRVDERGNGIGGQLSVNQTETVCIGGADGLSRVQSAYAQLAEQLANAQEVTNDWHPVYRK